MLGAYSDITKKHKSKKWFRVGVNEDSWVAQPVKQLTLNFDSGHYLRVVKLSPSRAPH